MADALGVDLGTTWTAAARCAPGGEAEALALGDHGPAMPSVLAVDGDAVLAGDAAERRLLAEPSSGAREPKRRLGDTTPYVIGGTPYGADTLMGHLLRHVLEAASAGDAGSPGTVVLTHPANWGEFKLDLLREAGRVAGVGDVTLLSEPEAAALHYLHLGRVHAGDAVAVYDFGGGTFDVAVVRCGDGASEVLGSPQGLERLGGLDLDDAVLAHVNASVDGHLGEVDPTNPDVRRALAQLRVECTRAKEALSLDSETSIPIALPDLVTEVRITRGEFESAIRPRLEDTLGAFDRALASAGLQAGDLAGVLLVGGSSRIPVVSELVAAHTGRPVLVDADAKLVVALGAAGAVMTTSQSVTEEPAMAETTPSEETKEAASAEAKGEGKGEKGDGKGGDAKRGDAAKRPAGSGGGGGGGGTRTIAGREVNLGRVAAGAAGVAAAGAAVAGAVATGLFDDDAAGASTTTAPQHDQQQGDEHHHHGDDSMDEFDSPAAGGGAGATGLTSHAGGGGGGAAHHAGGGGGGGGAVHHEAPAPVHHAGAEGGAAGMGGGMPGGTMTAPDIASARAELHDRLEHWQPPAGADQADVDKLRADLNHLIDNYSPVPGQSVDAAIANLQEQFQDRVHDFTQDQKIDALVEEEQRDNAAAGQTGTTTGTTTGTGMPGTTGTDPTQPAGTTTTGTAAGTGTTGTTTGTTGMPGTASATTGTTGMPTTDTGTGMPGTGTGTGMPTTDPNAGTGMPSTGTGTGMPTTDPNAGTGMPTTDPGTPAHDGTDPPTIPGTDLPDLTHDPNMEAPAGMGGTDPMGGGTGIIEDPARSGTMTDPAGTATTDPAGTIHFDHEPVQTGEPTNTGIVPPDLQTPTPDSPGGLADVFGEDQPWMDAASPDLGLSTEMTAATDAAAPQPMDAMATDAAPPAPAAPMFEDDLLGTNAMAQASAEAPPMPAFEAPAPEVTMTPQDLTPSFAPEEAAPMAPAHEVMAAPEPPPEEHHDFAPVDDSPQPDDLNQD